MHTPDAGDRRAAWSAYWSGGALHSCAGSFADNYSGAIGDFWRARFVALPDGARVLDLATGNGALPRLLHDTRRDAVDVEAVDLAAVAPRWIDPAMHRRIRFHAGVAMEQLPFPDGVFDLVASQFGFEYADRAPALIEALRVAGARGAVAFVMHHAGSVLAGVGRAELDGLTQLLAEDGLLAAGAAVLPWFARARSGADLRGVAAANAARKRYNDATRRVADAIAASAAPDVLIGTRDAMQRLLAGTGPDPAPSLAALEALRRSLAEGRLRTGEMLDCAADAAAIEAFAATLREARPALPVRVEELRQDEGVLAWAVRQDADA